MSTWAQSLIRISGYEVETLQKRLADVATRRATAEMRIAILDAEVEVERQRAAADPQAGILLQAYLKGWAQRRECAVAEVAVVQMEEEGARDALTRAFEELKKFEHVAEVARLGKLATANRLEAAQMDELGLRLASR
jgi:flagellar FliJ protein